MKSFMGGGNQLSLSGGRNHASARTEVGSLQIMLISGGRVHETLQSLPKYSLSFQITKNSDQKKLRVQTQAGTTP